MDLFSALSNFVRVVETGSFSRVAREIGLTHTAVTRQVAQLEQHFGVRLLHRTTRRLSLTDDGEILINYARRLLEESSAMEKELTAHRDGPSGLVRLGTIMGAGLCLAPRLSLLLSRCPGLSVELVVCDHINEMVESRLDLAMCDGRIADSSFIARQIAPLEYAVVAAPSYLERYGTPNAPAELDRHTCIVQDAENRRGFWQFNGPEGIISVPVSGQLITNNERAALVMARSGYGVAYLPDAQVHDDIRAGRLVRLMPQFEPKPSTLYVVYPSRRQLAPRTRAVLEFLIQQARLEQDTSEWAHPGQLMPRNAVPLPPVARTALTAARSAVIN